MKTSQRSSGRGPPAPASPGPGRGWHAAPVTFPAARRETLRHNPLNAVTAAVERLTDVDGATLVHKRLRPPDAVPGAEPGPWAASADPRHWNYWRREAEAYRDADLRESLRGTGLDLPGATVVEDAAGVTLWLEDVSGTPGTGFDLADHLALAESLGRWQARGPRVTAWGSRRFLREYSGSRPAPWELMDDDAAWQQPLIRDSWPDGLRDGWRRLLAHRPPLLDVMERLPRTRCHLDLWVSNEIRRPSGEVVLLDWASAGDGALGEDLGNHVPDAVFDLFWPAGRLAELDVTCFEAYLSGLRQAGWRGDDRDVRLGVVASCVKYAWLLPLLLGRASDREFRAYHEVTDGPELYRQRGLALAHLVSWCDEALRLAGR